ncbi:MAG TPA: sortase, partial [Anaerolineae bacterium]|nr:sortase [Anaerolineae bacterium]
PTSEPSAWPVPWPTPTPLWGTAPVRIRIPAINLDAPVTPVEWAPLETADGAQGIWQVPNWRAAGWHSSSALLGVPGNTVLNGHNTTYGEVFRDLYRLQEGAEILLEGENGLTYTYGVEALYILKEAHQPLEVRLENARYILPTTDERLTLVTCHPYGSIQNRLIVIARPAPAPPSEGEHP